MAFDFNSHSHRRFNPLSNTWVLISPHRMQRPWQGAQESSGGSSLPTYDPECYLCPRNKRANGQINPDYQTTFVFENDYAAVKNDQPDLPLTPVNEDEIKRGGDFTLVVIDLRQELVIASHRRRHWQSVRDMFQSLTQHVLPPLMFLITARLHKCHLKQSRQLSRHG
jgi:UDPglucose--hexose-1-phosphate uridylyltransferase